MTPDKKRDRITVRCGEQLYRLALEMQTHHRAEDLSEYLRGLIIRDAAAEGHSIDRVEVPAWTNNPEFRELLARASVGHQTELEREAFARKTKQSKRSGS